MPTYQVRSIEWTPAPPWGGMRPRTVASSLLSTHATYAEAAATCDEVNAKAWADPLFNPFLYGGESLFFQTTLPPGPFRDYLQDRGLDVPRSDITNTGWVRWYKSHRAKFTDAQFVAVQEALNLVRFGEVVEVPDGAAKAYAIRGLTWSTEPDAAGSNFVALYRDRVRAEVRSTELNEHDDEYNNFHDTVAIDWVGQESPSGQGVAVVYRREWFFRDTTYDAYQYQQRDYTTPVPVRVYADRAAADAYAAELMRVARRTLNPLVALPSPPRAVLARTLRFKSLLQPRDKRGRVIWHRSYGLEAGHLSDEQRAKVWALFDARPLYGVYEVPWGDE